MGVFIDEAHQFLNKKIGDELNRFELDVFGNIAKEGRKFGLNVVIATQRPRDIPEDVLSQIGAFLLRNTYSLCTLIAFITSRIFNALGDKGAMCSRLAFIRSAGKVYELALKSISAYRVPAASEARTSTRSYHSIK